ncbi:MAG TPA: ribbon-helix-helix domain-containing protein [Alphaproteobacteria bacterium]|nr:ribbon-helix-helix domain-containing protein [Alphaproteobacteria bacterium]USO06035.1 MAG: ribbon-helix-helix domain-containing protein [Rhodospirillales bacterium]HOO81825.1 ribbon-helix-helix domain-containing protein [Alphaproteobacteria bacterium]
MKKHSVNILGHQTSITLEDEFWDALKTEASAQDLSLNKLVAEIDEQRGENNLSSAIRLYILKMLQQKLTEATP